MKFTFVKAIAIIIVLWFFVISLISIRYSPNNSDYPSDYEFDSKENNVGLNLRHRNQTDETQILLLKIYATLQEDLLEFKKDTSNKMHEILMEIRRKNAIIELRKSARIEPKKDKLIANPNLLSSDYERTRRLLELDLKNIKYSLKDYEAAKEIEQVRDIYKVLRSNLNRLRDTDGFESVREKETAELSKIIQSRIQFLQNPQNCSKAKKLVCDLNKACGFGCQLHHVLYCLITAYSTGRTLILESEGWSYNKAGWDQIFLPLSDNCTSFEGEWPRPSIADFSLESDTQTIYLPLLDYINPIFQFLPISIPSEFSEKLERIHGEPQIWWVGQFTKFILRLQPKMQKFLDMDKQKAGFKSPIVGVHVRRTDKIGTEAANHSLKEYMVHVEEYFDIKSKSMDGVSLKRKVFIATDDPTVISEAKQLYPSPEWEILGDKQVAESGSLDQRYTSNGLYGIIRDVFLLSDCDFIVCTFSSQVCRLAYELMQSKHTDASGRFVSLDDIYYYGGGIGQEQMAHIAHNPVIPGEITLRIGDVIRMAGNHWNGMSKGTNRRTNELGLFPSYKARIKHPKVHFPENQWWSQSDRAKRRE